MCEQLVYANNINLNLTNYIIYSIILSEDKKPVSKRETLKSREPEWKLFSG